MSREQSFKVSVVMTAYNREKYIIHAIESVLMQQTDFEFEIVVGDDFSTDRTRAILQEYAKKFPHKIALLLHPQHIGLMANFVVTYQQCQGQYIAFLDSDDYWTDPKKLQKQVDFLDAHPDFLACAHWIEIVDQEGGRIISEYKLLTKHGPKTLKPYYTVEDILANGLFFHISTAMYRNALAGFPDWVMCLEIGNDLVLPLLHKLNDKIGFLDETMAVYRAHRQGMFSDKTRLTNLKRSERVFMIIGRNICLDKHESFRGGLSKRIYIELCKAYSAEGQLMPAINAAYKAVKIAPCPLKKSILSQVLSTLIRQGKWFRVPIKWIFQIYRLLRIYGLKAFKWCFGNTLYYRLKISYHRFRVNNEHHSNQQEEK